MNNMNRTCICLPTYNESANIRRVVELIHNNLPQATIMIIDDNSPDGTGRIADELAQHDPLLRVLHRHCKQGLGPAYLAGFARVLEDTDAQYIAQMDADLSHSPKYLPVMLEAAAEADLIIGSRYVPGGGTRNWKFWRKLLSRFGTIYARLWLGVPIRDLTGGFKLWQRDLLTKVLRRGIRSSGYSFQVETSFIAHRMGARIREIPIVFEEREQLASKMTMAIALEACWRVPLMRLQNLKPDPGDDT